MKVILLTACVAALGLVNCKHRTYSNPMDVVANQKQTAHVFWLEKSNPDKLFKAPCFAKPHSRESCKVNGVFQRNLKNFQKHLYKELKIPDSDSILASVKNVNFYVEQNKEIEKKLLAPNANIEQLTRQRDENRNKIIEEQKKVDAERIAILKKNDKAQQIFDMLEDSIVYNLTAPASEGSPERAIFEAYNDDGEDSAPGQPSRVVQIETGAVASHTCVRLGNGSVKCWGISSYGALGYGNHTENIGDDETLSDIGFVKIGAKATALAVGEAHTCVIVEGGKVKCWGSNHYGQLGYGNRNNIGDDETPDTVGFVKLGSKAIAIAAGSDHTCALLEGGNVKCWGLADNRGGQLGYGHNNNIGDDETLDTVGFVKLGSKAVALSAGDAHTCALLEGGDVKCWGSPGTHGILGTEGRGQIGDNETPENAPIVKLGEKATAVETGSSHTCAILQNGNVKCWGWNSDGQLGTRNLNALVELVNLGAKAVAVSGGHRHTCAILEGGNAKCWGFNLGGQLGYGHTNSSQTVTPNTLDFIKLGGKATKITAGDGHSCALFEDGNVKCWGYSPQNGYGLKKSIGDDETPDTVGFLKIQ